MSVPPRSVTVRAYGKVNLALRVGAVRPDGYHPLTSVFEAIDLAEVVTAHLTPAEAPLTCAVDPRSTCGAQLDVGPENLLIRAAQAVRSAVQQRHPDRPVPSAHLTVRKNIPVAGGMAGGSADAAAALVACNELWDARLDREALHELARGLGADVPFALEGGVALGTDRGDRLEPIAVPQHLRHHWVLALSGEGLSTPEVFRHFDASAAPDADPAPAGDLVAALAADPPVHPVDLAPLLVNDLTEPALDLRSDLSDTVAAFERAGALAVLMCGSGPTIAALCLDEQHAHSVAEVVRAAQVTSGVIPVSGPAPGVTPAAEGR